MGILEDMLKALDRIPAWKRLQDVPSEVDELKGRVAALEEKLGGKWPADVCRFCGERGLRLYHSFNTPDAKGYMREEWRCEICNKVDTRAYKPGVR